jgi:hypothetical protein
MPHMFARVVSLRAHFEFFIYFVAERSACQEIIISALVLKRASSEKIFSHSSQHHQNFELSHLIASFM